MVQARTERDPSPKNVCIIVMSGQAGELLCETAREMGITPQQLVNRAVVDWFKANPRPRRAG